ncbi:MAG: primosomal protein N' [Candidatus Promineofilum sp.]|nr:primosomal protein N' [Promineifilum sp.]
MSTGHYAEVVVNIETAISDAYHYHIPADMRSLLEVGHLVEVEFGRRLAQGVVVGLADSAPVEETKPVISLIAPEPVLWMWQIELARWLSRRYLAPLNACLRLLLPPGLTRWADAVYDVNPYWSGDGRLTDVQQQLVDLLRARGDLRSRQIGRVIKGKKWSAAATQLVNRGILRRASVLDPPRVRPKHVRTVELIAGPKRVFAGAAQLGRASKAADILHYLVDLADPLPEEAEVLDNTGTSVKYLKKLVDEGLITRLPAAEIVAPSPTKEIPADQAELIAQLPLPPDELPHPEYLSHWLDAGWARIEAQPALISLAVPRRRVVGHVLRLRGAEIYGRILAVLAREARAVPIGEIYEATGANLSHLRRLAELDLVRLGDEHVWRDSLADRDFAPADPPELTLDQARVWGRIKVAMIEASEAGDWNDNEDDGHEESAGEARVDGDGSTDPLDAATPFLLHGVTGSGKTEIYMRAIEFALARGQQAIVMVPEIALTPQTVRRFAARFPGRVAVLHSALSDGERYDTWRRARQGLFDIVIGPRSALFTPLPNLGVIVLDEEHDGSYKQTPPVPPPYYHAREAAIALAGFTGAIVILGSATPDVVTYHRAQAGRYQLLELPKRIMGHRRRIESQAERLQIASRYRPLSAGGEGQDILMMDEALTIPLPPIQLVDMRQELRAGNRSVFSRALDAAISETLSRGEQSILFLNRRGSATFVNCRDCGHVMNCPNCGIPLTYHQPNMMLVCHQCGRREAQPHVCPNCGSDRIRYFGLGTEKLAEMVRERWPEARLVRWDRDTTSEEGSHEALLAGFINRESDILVGTQMIAKGLDLPFVTLVGVISADISLGLPDYNTGERAFQVLAQVAGRAGRGLLGGRVVVQTYNPEHYAVRSAADHDYAGFYVEEIRFRTRQGLPPFRRMVRLLINDPINERAERLAREMAQRLKMTVHERSLAATDVLGPTPAFFTRLDGRYRWHIVVHTPDPYRLLQGIAIPKPWIVDIDPESTL